VGLCGATNDVAAYGLGIWRIVKTTQNGRFKVLKVTDQTILARFLDKTGYPNLLREIAIVECPIPSGPSGQILGR
jgi:hypothetical protein